MTVTVSRKGQLVIPARVRKRYRLVPGSQVEVLDSGREIILVPIPKDVFRASRGLLKGYSVQEFLRWRRYERQQEHVRLQ